MAELVHARPQSPDSPKPNHGSLKELALFFFASA
jgi:hypothetical protein